MYWKYLKNCSLTIGLTLILYIGINAQENYRSNAKVNTTSEYRNSEHYLLKTLKKSRRLPKPKNIVLMIGDGMGLTHITAALTANGNQLNLLNFLHCGFVITTSANKYVTDSAAGGTALSTGKKTKNKVVGLDTNYQLIKNIIEIAEEYNLSTGIVSTSSLTHATPASFVAHQESRLLYEEIAQDYVNSNLDVFIGGGLKNFTDRKDNKDLITELRKKNYTVLTDIDSISLENVSKLACFTAHEHNPPYPERGPMLQKSAIAAMQILSKNANGFFLMIEGSQIDWGGHQNNIEFIVKEIHDFDRTIGDVLEFASQNQETLVIVTSDHETGGLSLKDGNSNTGEIQGQFNTVHHTGAMVPIFAFGPGEELFTGIMQNTDIFNKIVQLMRWEKEELVNLELNEK